MRYRSISVSSASDLKVALTFDAEIFYETNCQRRHIFGAPRFYAAVFLGKCRFNDGETRIKVTFIKINNTLFGGSLADCEKNFTIFKYPLFFFEII